MRTRKKQAGMTFLSWLVVALVGMVALVCVMKLGPVYLENFTAKGILNQIVQEARGEKLSRFQIRQRLEKKFLINTVKGLSMKDIVIEDKDGQVTIDANYEVRKRLFYNIDVVLVFDDMLVSVQAS